MQQVSRWIIFLNWIKENWNVWISNKNFYYGFYDLARSTPSTSTLMLPVTCRQETGWRKKLSTYCVRFEFYLQCLFSSLFWMSNTPDCCTRYLEVQGCFLMSRCCFRSGEGCLMGYVFIPHKEFAARAVIDISHRAQNPRPTKDFSGIVMSLSWLEDRWKSPKRSWERECMAYSLDLLTRGPSQKECWKMASGLNGVSIAHEKGKKSTLMGFCRNKINHFAKTII